MKIGELHDSTKSFGGYSISESETFQVVNRAVGIVVISMVVSTPNQHVGSLILCDNMEVRPWRGN